MNVPRLVRKRACLNMAGLPMECEAWFSPSMKFRYFLSRIWRNDKPCLVGMGLNPSTATHLHNDPTISKLVSRAIREGAGGLIMLNAFGFRATDPREMKRHYNPIGLFNDRVIFETIEELRKKEMLHYVLAMWGNHGTHLNRGPMLLRRLKNRRFDVRSLSTTSTGQPGHILYLPNALEAIAA